MNEPDNPRIIMKMKTLTSLLSIALAFCACSTLHAQLLLNVKIGSTTLNGGSDGVYQEGAAVLGSANSWWNEYAFISTTPSGVSVVDDANNPISGVTLTVHNVNGVGAKATSGTNPDFLFGSMPYQNPGGEFDITLTGLNANTQYEFIGYAARTSSSAGASWAVTTGTLDSGTTVNDGSSMDISTGVGKAYSDFLATTDGSGNLVITDTGNPSSSITVLAGFQLAAISVPEPSIISLAIIGLGLLVGSSFRRRQSRV